MTIYGNRLNPFPSAHFGGFVMTLLVTAHSRRTFMRGLAFGSALFTTPGLFAEQLFSTPSLTEGPFYPDRMPLDVDNDLLIINDSITPAVGEITNITGRLLEANGSPLKDVTIEIWQCDANAVYLHSADSTPKKKQQDKNFQGFGRFTTGSTGEYRFRTIKPVPYPGRPAPHIHMKIKKGDKELLTTQLFIRGHEGNVRDGVFLGTRDLVDRELLMADFKPLKESKTGEFAAAFDIVLGRTPDETSFESNRLQRR
jgi:protocatechuate 3,4-dioxygenase beta subunit